jgi:hypothetical protein
VHRTPKHIARALRAFRRAHKLGLLQHVRIVPGASACIAAHAQRGISYICDAVPELPLGECTRQECDCDYAPMAKRKIGGRRT